MKTALLTIFILFGSHSVGAFDEKSFVWNDFAASSKMSEEWSLWAGTSLRHETHDLEPVQYIFPRVIFNYRVNERNSLGFGYENFFNPTDGNPDRSAYENRNTFQHVYHFVESPWMDVLQTRLEVRKLDGEPRAWLRTRVFARVILHDWDEHDQRFVFENEVFFYLNPDEVPGETLEGNWTTLAWDKQLAENWTGRLGYMAQWLNRDGDDLLSHTFRTGLTYSF